MRALGHSRVAVRRRERHRRTLSRGQSMVEFALVCPIFVMLVFATIEGGLLLFSVNAADNATTVSGNQLAALGSRSDADVVALKTMIAQGLGNSGLVSVGEIDIAKLTPDAQNGYARNADGSPKVATTCSSACLNAYRISDPGGTPTVRTWSGNCDPLVPPCTVPWDPGSRSVINGQSDFVEVVIHYSYSFFSGITAPLTLSATKTFRLEPQQ